MLRNGLATSHKSQVDLALCFFDNSDFSLLIYSIARFSLIVSSYFDPQNCKLILHLLTQHCSS